MIKVLKLLGIFMISSIIFVGCDKENVKKIMNGDEEMNKQGIVNDDLTADVGETNNKELPESEIVLKETVAFETDLDEYEAKMFEIANAWSNGYMFDCTWRRDNITFENGIMRLTIDTDGVNASPRWSGSEYRTKKFYSYGLFEVKMKPIKNNGVVSSFFTYTGPSDSNPWDEIDIEFLGRDTTKMQLNYFTDGVGDHEYMHDLGFDASEEFHTYAFEWLPDSITWYVDGEAIYTATDNIPSTPGKVMMNVWPGTGVDGWLKPFDGTVPLTAEYDWIRVTQYDIEAKK